MEKEVIGYIISGFGILTTSATLTWIIATRVFSERLKAAEDREKEYKEKISRIPELEKTIASFESKKQYAEFRSQFTPDAETGIPKKDGVFYCGHCLYNDPPIATPVRKYFSGVTCPRCNNSI